MGDQLNQAIRQGIAQYGPVGCLGNNAGMLCLLGSNHKAFVYEKSC